jgi:hypothetical protein
MEPKEQTKDNDEVARRSFLIEASDIMKARTRDALATSDGGGSGRSDTNDNMIQEPSA